MEWFYVFSWFFLSGLKIFPWMIQQSFRLLRSTCKEKWQFWHSPWVAASKLARFCCGRLDYSIHLLCQHVTSWLVKIHRAACSRNLVRNNDFILLWFENFETFCLLVQLQSVVKLELHLVAPASLLIHLALSKSRLTRYFYPLCSVPFSAIHRFLPS